MKDAVAKVSGLYVQKLVYNMSYTYMLLNHASPLTKTNIILKRA